MQWTRKRSEQQHARDSGVVARGVTDLRESDNSQGFLACYLSLARMIFIYLQSLVRPEKKHIEIQKVRNKAIYLMFGKNQRRKT